MVQGSATTSLDETDPLLSNDDPPKPTSASPSPTGPRTRCTWPWLHVVGLAMLGGVASCVGEVLFAAPRIRLFESTICARYYAQHDPSVLPSHGQVPEYLCKRDFLQDELAAVLGGQYFFDSIPAILFPIPYGLLADQYGRKWILVTSCIGFTLSYGWTLLTVGVLALPLQWAWFSSAFYLLGGGPTISTYLLTTVVADVVPPASRSTVFFYRYCTDSIAELIVPALASYLMSHDIWVPLLGAVLFQGINCLISAALPETAPWPVSSDAVRKGDSCIEAAERPPAVESSSSSPRRERLERKAGSSFRILTRNSTVAALTFTFMISKTGRQSSNILLQYVSKRYGWTLSEAGLLLSLRASVNIVLYTVIMPAIATFILERVGAPTIRDLLLARGSIVLLVFGAVVLSLSATPALMIIGVILFTLGTGFPHAARGLITSITESHSSCKTTSDIALLYAFLSVAEGVGSLIAAVSMSWMLRFGLSLGRQWLGLPFGLSAILFLSVALVMFGINMKP